jgi:ABC-type methionine transport system ATPase subunit
MTLPSFAAKQEFSHAAVKAATIMATQTLTEKKYRIHFPLEQLSTPVVTQLVTDYDLSPNLLRADVDAKNGGWLVLGLTGEEARLEAALDWLRGQGLGVEKEEG